MNCFKCFVTNKYLDHYITDDLSDDNDINRQPRTMYVQGNIILGEFNVRYLEEKIKFLFILFTHVYGGTLMELREIHLK